jgi:K+-sensing histidine kinase KdpD
MYATTRAVVGEEHRKGRRQQHSRMVLLKSMAHEWQTPLTSIKDSVSALPADSGLEPSPRKDLLVVIAEKANRLNRLASEALHT